MESSPRIGRGERIVDRREFILLAGMNEIFSLPIGAGKRLNCDRVKYIVTSLR